MIEKMKRITIVCLAPERDRAVQAMADLASIHVEPDRKPASEAIDALLELQSRARDAAAILQSQKRKRDRRTDGAAPAAPAAPEAVARILRLVADRKALLEDAGRCRQALEELRPWGRFSEESLRELQAHGWSQALCVCPEGRLPELPEGASLQVVRREKGRVYFLVLSPRDLSGADLPRARFPLGMDLAGLEKRLAGDEDRIRGIDDRLRQAAREESAPLAALLRDLAGRIEFARARDGMGHRGQSLAYLSGYVPEAQFPRVREAARREGWALLHENADRNDRNVPTKLAIPRPFRMAQRIFDFIGVVPGYNETDVSIPMLVFLSIFCGMLIGDAGYGLVFTALGAWLLARTRSGRARDGVLLLTVMAASVLVFGALSGNWLGIDRARLPLLMRGIPWLRDDANGDHLKLLCFFLGVFHLTLARIWAAAIAGRVRAALGHLGWGAFLWGNFFTVKMLLVGGGPLGRPAIVLYAAGTALILACGVDWKDLGQVIYLPFNFINSLVDVLSYIRLYAVGLASFYIASNFNSMGRMVWDISPWLAPAAVLVVLVGHGLNIASAAMGVLVHGIRLNTLEFSGHLGLGWAGKAYRAFGSDGR